jgi:FKBP-type peptidyl-prolyl cis-trans isomerase SlyD
MKAAADTVVTFHYALSDDAGEAIESSQGRDPLTVLLGRGGLVAGVEQALIGHEAGEKFEAVVTPEQGYGARREDWTQRVPKKHFHDPDRLRPGMQTMLQERGGGGRVVTVVKVGTSVIDVDLNHPMAGRTLHFALELVSVRAASAEELEHGHAHGPGGHPHG